MRHDIHMCACGGEGLVYEADDDGLMISLWRYGRNGGKHWRNQLRHIWYVLKHGHPFTDDVIMDWTTAEEFARGILLITESPPGAEMPPELSRDPIQTELCKCGHTAIQHSMMFWLPINPRTGKVNIGSCFCECQGYRRADPNGIYIGEYEDYTPIA